MIPIKPMLCKLSEESELKALTASGKYIFEPKLDGERLVVEVKNGKVAGMYARSGREKAYMYPDLKLSCTRDCVLDGEVVSTDNTFNGIQHRANRQNGIAQAVIDYPVRYSVFDIISIDNLSVEKVALTARKDLLKMVCMETDNVKLTPMVYDGVALFNLMKTNHLEGVVGKTTTGFYQEGKRDWIKVKCWQEKVFIAVGYTSGTGHRANQFGALVLADVNRAYVGNVGSGFDEDSIRDIMKLFSPGSCPWTREPEQATWITPFPVRVKFLEFSADGMVRFPVFKGVVSG
jgi:ATP-dependent DNA ligase